VDQRKKLKNKDSRTIWADVNKGDHRQEWDRAEKDKKEREDSQRGS
jgi:hypothetical protein